MLSYHVHITFNVAARSTHDGVSFVCPVAALNIERICDIIIELCVLDIKEEKHWKF